MCFLSRYISSYNRRLSKTWFVQTIIASKTEWQQNKKSLSYLPLLVEGLCSHVSQGIYASLGTIYTAIRKCISFQTVSQCDYIPQLLFVFLLRFFYDRMPHLGEFHWGWMTSELRESFQSKSTAGANPPSFIVLHRHGVTVFILINM